VQFSKKFPNATAGLSQGYGLTETNAIVTALAAEDSLLRPTSCGSPALVNDIKIVNMDTNVEEPIGTAGEVLIKGESSRPCTLRRCPVLTIVVLNYKAPMSQVSIGTTLKQQRKRSPKMDGSNRAYFTSGLTATYTNSLWFSQRRYRIPRRGGIPFPSRSSERHREPFPDLSFLMCLNYSSFGY
jgi:acyl-CoA synthetase (AMP-forming)/AMP-acid ligase II